MPSNPIRIHIPAPLRAYTDESRTVTVEGDNAGAALQGLVTRYPRLKDHLYDENGRLRSYVNVYVNDEDIRYLNQTDTPLEAGDELSIVPSIAGG